MRHPRTVSFAALLTLATVALAGCSSSNSTGPSGNTALVGTYTLVSLTEQGTPTVTPPIATGTLTLTQSTYTVNITIAVPGQATQTIDDAGTYTVSGSNWTQTSGTLNVQGVGSYTLSNGTLTVNVTTSGQSSSTVWQKQG